ncbi:MAG: Mur ligase family protein [Candidatus Levybacteria bacterium]|nr:Mur ligase family protein [Candidatus Levybacteria bacterium]
MWQDAKNIYHLFVAVLANAWCGFPSRKLIVIGVTGTDGKTTTVNAIFHILKTAGLPVSMISTTGAVINGKDYDVGFHVTTPSSWAVQRFLKQAAVADSFSSSGSCQSFSSRQCSSKSHPAFAGVERLRAVGNPSNSATPHSNENFESSPRHNHRYMVLELTSHALDQYRDWGINYEVGVLTNITNEHLDYHKTYEKYVKAKSILLKRSKVAIINRDDRSYEYICKLKNLFRSHSGKRSASRIFAFCRFWTSQNDKKRVVAYGLKNKADFDINDLPSGLDLAEFNKYNLLAAIAACKSLGVKDEDIKKGAKSFVPPLGRLQTVYHKDFDVMIDFAHTPNGFEQLLSSIRPSVKGRIIHVFGSAGERDSRKRLEMGKISSKYSDIIILTAEDPRSESIDEINKQIISGIQKSIHIFRHAEFNSASQKILHYVQDDNGRKYLIEIQDRQEAINIAVKMAEKGDLVLLTGKAHEKSMNYGKGELPWSEHEAVKKALI